MTRDEQKPLVGRTFRDNFGGHRMTVVDEDDRFVYMKRADEPKKHLAHSRGGYPVGRVEFASSWSEVKR